MLGVSEPFGDTKSQDVGPRRLQAFLGPHLLRKGWASGWEGPFLRDGVGEEKAPLLNSCTPQGASFAPSDL